MAAEAQVAIKIRGDSTQLQSDLKKGGRALDAFENKAKAMQSQMLKVGAASAAAGVAMATALYKQQAGIIDRLAKTADALGVTTENLQALRHMAGLAGVESEELDKAIQRMSKGLGDAARKGGAAADALDDIGVNIQDVLKLSADKQMEVLAKALLKVENHTEKASIASDLFGRNGLRMLKVLQQLETEGLKPTIDSIDAMGASLSRVDAAKVEDANDAVAKAMEAASGLAKELTVTLAPIVQKVADAFTNWVKESGGLREKLAELQPYFSALVSAGKIMAVVYGVQIVVAMSAYAASTYRSIIANAALVKSMTMVSGVARGLRIALALLGGPIGVIAAVATSLFFFKSSSNDAADAADDLSLSVDMLNQSMEGLSQTGAKVALIDIEKPLRQAAKAAESAQVDVDRQIEKFKSLNASYLEEMNRFQVYMKAGATDTAIGYGMQAEAIKAKMPEYQEALDRANLILEEAIKTEQALLDRKAALQGIATGSAPKSEEGGSDTQRLMEKQQQDHQMMLEQQKKNNEEIIAATDLDSLEQKYGGYYERRQEAQKAHDAKMIEEHKAALDKIKEDEGLNWKERTMLGLGFASQMLGSIAGLMDTSNKKQFAIAKAANIAQASIDGIAAAVGAFKVGTQIGGPILGGAFATASALTTGAMISQMASQKFGGSAQTPSTAVSQPAAQGANAGQTMTVQGLDSNSFYSGEMVTGLVDKLLDYQRDGGRVILG